MIRYWLTPDKEKDKQFDEKVKNINELYHQAPELVKKGEAVMSTDEMTGVQALERKHPGLPMAPGKIERREFEYIRHGTASFIMNFNVCTGQIGKVSAGSTRTEEDFARHIRETVESSPSIAKWHFVVDNLNTHQSESLVRYVADESDINFDLGVKRKSGILKSMQTRTAFLSDL